MAAHLDLEEQEQLDQLKAFWAQWGNLITWLLVIVLAGFAGWQFWNYHQREQAAKAEGLYGVIEAAASAKDAGKAVAMQATLQSDFPSTSYAAQGGLLVARVAFDAGKVDQARASLGWVAEHGNEQSYRDIANLRLAGMALDAKQYDAAAKALDAVKGAEFSALVADRRGDMFLLMNKPQDAKAQFVKAYAAMDKKLDYRRLVGMKLASLGVAVADADATGAAQ